MLLKDPLQIIFPKETLQRVSFLQRPPKIIIIAGPTASGKTELSLQIAKRLPRAEIISADSMQFYRGMDIGTAKLPFEARQEIPHHLIDIVDVSKPLTVHEFFGAIEDTIQGVLRRQATPIIVGGSGFYLQTLLYGPPDGPPSDPALRKQLEERIERLGVEALYEELSELDPVYAATITRGDRHKVVRALEIIALTKQLPSAFSWRQRAIRETYDFRCWLLFRDRTPLIKRIEKRCEKMVEEGFLEEVARLKEHGLLKNSSASRAIGYRHALDYLKTQQSPDDFITFLERFKRDSCRLVKKQMTWFRREPGFRWINLDHCPTEKAVQTICNDYAH